MEIGRYSRPPGSGSWSRTSFWPAAAWKVLWIAPCVTFWILVTGPGCDAAALAAGPSSGGFLEVLEPVRVELESIRVEPPDREAVLLVRRFLPLRTGQTVGPGDLVQARDQLAASGLFDEVDIYTTRGSRPGAVCAVVAATPSHRFALETGLGYRALEGWYLNIIGVRRSGLFDRGGTARLSFRTGLGVSGLYGEMEVPGLLPNDLDLLVNLEMLDVLWTVLHEGTSYYQELDRGRFLLGVRRRLNPDLDLVWRAGLSRALAGKTLLTYDDGPSLPASDLLPVHDDFLNFFLSEGELVRNRRDRLRPWQAGSLIGVKGRFGAPDRGPAFAGAECEASVAVPVAETRAAAFRVRGVYTDPGTPYFLRPVVGGIGSLRGFSNAGLSGPLGARALWQASAEWRHPLAGDDPLRPRVIGTLFGDIGDHWSARGRRHGVSADAGFGLLFRVRWIETLNVEIGYPITEEPTNSPVAVRVSLGRSF